YVEKSESTGTWRIYAGASAGQSPLIHCLDVALGIEHKSMSSTSSQDSKTNPMLEMREFLSDEHRNFINDLGTGPSIRAVINKLSDLSNDTNTPTDIQTMRKHVVQQFNNCVKGMKEFRDKHLQVVTKYIILQKGKSRDVKPLLSASDSSVISSSPGSGMTAHMPRNSFSEFGGSSQTELLPLSVSPMLPPLPSFNGSLLSEYTPNNQTNGNDEPTKSVYGQTLLSVVDWMSNLTPTGRSKSDDLSVVSVEFTKDGESDGKALRGTGGTDLLPFLRQVRKETEQAFV
ncbi:hypothetical protein HK096_000954, partial [Nowakowskiella sp. JEL0078]